ncbi:hypothetical protein [Amycolatopsis thermophila]|uniref:Uncharacterized protein n=1 Tax=Amycolatopsis thermophila TaxID=206084 RepID=A0ABU0ENB5_9PSEU|nr:hypothetical protein [Amycolatopsis thermophila]MDQ0376786.1 hypothetical protein [Amycolatopsis thermophila]
MSGGPRVRLVAVDPRTWRSCHEIADVFTGPEWECDRDRVDQALRAP